MKLNLAVIGSTSMVGSQFCQQVEQNFDVVKGDFPQVDITRSDLVEKFFANYDFAHLILFSAFTDVGRAEEQRGKKDQPCWQINVTGTQNVVSACKKYNRSLIFISSDFIFDGTDGPYYESDPPGPDLSRVSWYGITKIEAETLIANNLNQYIILRIAYPYSGRDTGKDDLVLRIIKLFKEDNLYPMYVDQIITPTYIPDIAPGLLLLLEKNLSGIIHLASPQSVSQYEFAKELIKKAKASGPRPLSQKSIDDDYRTKGTTPRPKNGGLLVDKIKDLGFNPTPWRVGIEKSVNLWLK